MFYAAVNEMLESTQYTLGFFSQQSHWLSPIGLEADPHIAAISCGTEHNATVSGLLAACEMNHL